MISFKWYLDFDFNRRYGLALDYLWSLQPCVLSWPARWCIPHASRALLAAGTPTPPVGTGPPRSCGVWSAWHIAFHWRRTCDCSGGLRRRFVEKWIERGGEPGCSCLSPLAGLKRREGPWKQIGSSQCCRWRCIGECRCPQRWPRTRPSLCTLYQLCLSSWKSSYSLPKHFPGKLRRDWGSC